MHWTRSRIARKDKSNHKQKIKRTEEKKNGKNKLKTKRNCKQTAITKNLYVKFWKRNNDEYLFSIKDNGIGISAENQSKIFDMFYRVSSSSVGSGLGLYIVKETIDKLNGQIEIESELSKGTTFNIHIPNNN